MEDHIDAIDIIFHSDFFGETFNIGGNNELTNNKLVNILCEKMDEKLKPTNGSSKNLIKFVKDRPGHDLRYAIDASKLAKMLNWLPAHSFETGLEKTIDWYLDNQKWLDDITTGDYQQYYNKQYKQV